MSKSFSGHVTRVEHVNEQMTKTDMNKAGRELRKEVKAGKDKIVDISVSCDSTWARRGFQFLYDITSAIHVERLWTTKLKERFATSAELERIQTQGNLSGVHSVEQKSCAKVRGKLNKKFQGYGGCHSSRHVVLIGQPPQNTICGLCWRWRLS